MKKCAFFWAAVSFLCIGGCAPVTITKTYTEHYWDPHTGKEITYTETIVQVPEQRQPVHLKHAELYE